MQCLVCNALAQDELMLNEKAEPGKSYALCRLLYDTPAVEEKPARVLKFSNTAWKIELDTIYRDTFAAENYQRVLVKEASTKWVYYNKLDRNCLSVNPLDCVVLAHVDVPASYESIYFTDADSFKVVEVERIVEGPKIELVDEVCVNLSVKEDQSRLVLMDEFQNILYIKMVAGHWSEWREVFCSGPRGGYSIRDIQIKLRDLGYYKGPIDNVISQEMKLATVKFQKERALPVGQFDMKTLKALGIRY